MLFRSFDAHKYQPFYPESHPYLRELRKNIKQYYKGNKALPLKEKLDDARKKYGTMAFEHWSKMYQNHYKYKRVTQLPYEIKHINYLRDSKPQPLVKARLCLQYGQHVIDKVRTYLKDSNNSLSTLKDHMKTFGINEDPKKLVAIVRLTDKIGRAHV